MSPVVLLPLLATVILGALVAHAARPRVAPVVEPQPAPRKPDPVTIEILDERRRVPTIVLIPRRRTSVPRGRNA